MSFRVVSGKELLEIDPSLSHCADELCGALYFPDDHAGNAYLFTCEIEKAAKQMGVTFHYGVSVDKIVKEGGRVRKIETSVGTKECDHLVLAAGSYSTPLAKAVGINIPVRPAKGYSLSIPMKGWNAGPKMPINDDDFHAAVTPLGNTLRVAGTAEFAGLDASLDRARLDALYDLVKDIYPDFYETIDRSEVAEWAGLRPLSLDGSPYLGKTEIENLYLNTGHGPLGWTMACGSAQMLSDIIAGKETALDKSAYNIKRT